MEQRRACGFLDRLHRGMGDATLRGDRVEARPDLRRPAYHLDAVPPRHVLLYRGGRRKEAVAVLAQGLEKRVVRHLRHDERFHGQTLEPGVERSPQRRVLRGEEERRSVERLRKAPFVPGSESRCGEDGDAALPEKMSESADRRPLRHGSVRQDQIERVPREPGEKLVRRRLGDYEPHLSASRRSEKLASDELGERVHHPDAKLLRPPGGTAAHHVQKLAAEAEDLVRVSVHDASHLGGLEGAALALEELFAQRLFESADLRAQRRVREPKLFRGPGDSAFANGCPEVQEVVVVEPFHLRQIYRMRACEGALLRYPSPQRRSAVPRYAEGERWFPGCVDAQLAVDRRLGTGVFRRFRGILATPLLEWSKRIAAAAASSRRSNSISAPRSSRSGGPRYSSCGTPQVEHRTMIKLGFRLQQNFGLVAKTCRAGRFLGWSPSRSPFGGSVNSVDHVRESRLRC